MINDWDAKVIELIRDFSSEKFQSEAWFGLKENVICSPNEMCNQLDDILFEDWISSKDFSGVDNLKKHLFIFLQSVDDLPAYDEALEAFASVEWQSIRLKAKVILIELEVFIRPSDYKNESNNE